MATSTKRPRAPSSPSSSLNTSTGLADPPHKASRIIHAPADFSDITATSGSSDTTLKGYPTGTAPLLCNLPPTCHRQPTPIANTTELERHYAKYHAHVCEDKGCGCVFPEARLLELHQTECHDPLAQIRKERGEKIFQCHIPAPTCGRNFLTPKARRLHLIQAHSYPKEYFFAVTNKGIGGLLKKWGEAASMVRKEWKPREGTDRNQDAEMKRYREEESDKMDEDDDEENEEEDDTSEDIEESEEPDKPFVEEEDDPIDLEATPRMLPRTTGIASPQSSISTPKLKHAHAHSKVTDNVDVTGLVNSLDSLSLVPDSIRFGRGGKIGGFVPNGNVVRGRGRARGRGRGEPANLRGRGGLIAGGIQVQVNAAHAPRVDSAMVDVTAIPRGRGRGRGAPRGRARGPARGRGL